MCFPWHDASTDTEHDPLGLLDTYTIPEDNFDLILVRHAYISTHLHGRDTMTSELHHYPSYFEGYLQETAFIKNSNFDLL